MDAKINMVFIENLLEAALTKELTAYQSDRSHAEQTMFRRKGVRLGLQEEDSKKAKRNRQTLAERPFGPPGRCGKLKALGAHTQLQGRVDPSF
jgi:hypothetical protein